MKKILYLFILFGFSQTEVRAQEITRTSGFFKNKYHQKGKEINKKELTAILEQGITAFNHLKKSKTFNRLSFIALTTEAGFAIWGIAGNNPKNDNVADIGVYSSLAAVIAFSILSNSQNKKAISKYNQSLDNACAFSIKPSKNGFGVILQF